MASPDIGSRCSAGGQKTSPAPAAPVFRRRVSAETTRPGWPPPSRPGVPPATWRPPPPASGLRAGPAPGRRRAAGPGAREGGRPTFAGFSGPFQWKPRHFILLGGTGATRARPTIGPPGANLLVMTWRPARPGARRGRGGGSGGRRARSGRPKSADFSAFFPPAIAPQSAGRNAGGGSGRGERAANAAAFRDGHGRPGTPPAAASGPPSPAIHRWSGVGLV